MRDQAILVLIDANVLIYAEDARFPDKRTQAKAWIDALWSTGCGSTSFQVLTEFYNIVTRRMKPGLSRHEARTALTDYLAWHPVETDAELVRSAWALEDQLGFTHWDCLIIAAALKQECSHLLTEDLQHGQKIMGLTIISPFQIAPQALFSH